MLDIALFCFARVIVLSVLLEECSIDTYEVGR